MCTVQYETGRAPDSRTRTIDLPVRSRNISQRALRCAFGTKREEVAGAWKHLHNEELRNFCASSDVIRVIKSMRMT
jgi:hypothetical protein